MPAPIELLPLEILGEVLHFYSVTQFDAPIVFGCVSHLFRYVALGTPNAWTHLHIGPDNQGNQAAQQLMYWSAHAGSCSIDLHLHIGQGNHDPLIRAVNVTRLHSLVLHAETRSSVHSFLGAIDPLVVATLEVHIARDDVSETLPQHLPNAKHLRLTNYIIPAPYLPMNLLQTLVVKRPLRAKPLPVQILVDILASGQGLRHVEIQSRLTAPVRAVLNLPDMRHLSLRVNNIPAIIRNIVAPCLSSLRLDELHSRREGYMTELGTSLHHLLEFVTSEAQRRMVVVELSGVETPHIGDEQAIDWAWCSRQAQITSLGLPRHTESTWLAPRNDLQKYNIK